MSEDGGGGGGRTDDWRGPVRTHRADRLEGRLLIFNRRLKKTKKTRCIEIQNISL